MTTLSGVPADPLEPYFKTGVTMIELLAISMVSVYLVAMVGAMAATHVARYHVRRNLTLRES